MSSIKAELEKKETMLSSAQMEMGNLVSKYLQLQKQVEDEICIKAAASHGTSIAYL